MNTARRRRFALVTLGSAGDLHPYLAIGRALAEQGHEVHLLSQAPYATDAAHCGLHFHAIANEAAHQQTLTHPRLWQPIAGFGVLWRYLCVPAIGPTLAVLRELATGHTASDPLRVLASPLAVGARFARDVLPIHLWSGYTAPSGLRHIDPPMFLGGWEVPAWWPAGLRRLLWRGIDRWKLEPMARPLLTRWQIESGAQALPSSLFGDWIHSPDGGLALYDRDFAAVPPEWQARGVQQVGFPLYERDTAPLPPDLLDFLDQGEPPVVVFTGSAGSTLHLGQMAAQAVETAGRRCVLIAPLPSTAVDQPPPSSAQSSTADSSIHTNGPVNLAALLPRSAALIHHGGIGTLAQARAAHIPQLILASAYDQFENAARLDYQGEAVWRRAANLRSGDLTPALEQLWRLPDFALPPRTEQQLHSHTGAPNAAVRLAIERMSSS